MQTSNNKADEKIMTQWQSKRFYGRRGLDGSPLLLR